MRQKHLMNLQFVIERAVDRCNSAIFLDMYVSSVETALVNNGFNASAVAVRNARQVSPGALRDALLDARGEVITSGGEVITSHDVRRPVASAAANQ